jgi:H+/Cl- antiporter ClcA
VLYSGQAGVPALAATGSTEILAILLVGKALGYAVSLGCGFRGGPSFPAIFIAIAIAEFAHVWFDISPTLAVAVGAAAGTRLLITSTLFASLLVGTRGLDAVPAAVLAAVAAWLTMQALERRAVPQTPQEG